MTAPMPAASPWWEDVVDAARSDADRLAAWAFTIVHGDVEDPNEAAALDDIAALARRTGHLLTRYATNDTTVYVFAEDGGRLACLALQAQATLHGRLWWRTYTRFGGDG